MTIRSKEYFNLTRKHITLVDPSLCNKNYIYIYMYFYFFEGEGFRDYILCFKGVHGTEKVKNLYSHV
jgi:hypothetical protein